MPDNIQFEDGGSEFHIKSRRIFGDPETPTMIRLLLKYKIVKNEKQAVAVLLGIILVALSATFLLYFKMNYSNNVVILKNGAKITVEEYVKGLKLGLYD